MSLTTPLLSRGDERAESEGNGFDKIPSSPQRLLNIVRQVRHSDEYNNYQTITVLGEESMESVSAVLNAGTTAGNKANAADDEDEDEDEDEDDNWVNRMYCCCRRRDRQAQQLLPPQHRTKRSSSLARVLGLDESKSYELKSVRLDQVTDDFLAELRNELEIVRMLDHPNVVKACDAFEFNSRMFIVMENCSGGNLRTRMPYSEQDAERIVLKILTAVEHMHCINVVHRNLKLENILFESQDYDADIKITDFGLSKILSPSPNVLLDDCQMTEQVGSLYTIAPEVLRGSYTYKADLWSVGVIAFTLLSGRPPFWGRDIKVKIGERNCDFTKHPWTNISQDAKDFVDSLLTINPKKRLSAQEALKSKWLVKHPHRTCLKPKSTIFRFVPRKHEQCEVSEECRKLVLMVIARHEDTNDVLGLRDMFDECGKPHEKAVSFTDFRDGWKEFHTALS